jgi:hypothetical protein
MSNVETLSAAAQFEPLTANEIRKMNAYWHAVLVPQPTLAGAAQTRTH